MTNTKDLGKVEFTENKVKRPQRFNRIWGENFLVLDGNFFRGGISGDDYDKLIDFLVEMWNNIISTVINSEGAIFDLHLFYSISFKLIHKLYLICQLRYFLRRFFVFFFYLLMV